MGQIYVGIDCGATNLRVGLVDKEGKLLDSIQTHSPLKTDPSSLAQMVKAQLEKMEIKDVEGVGIGVPGPLDLGKGIILPSANIKNQEAIDIRGQFERVFNRPLRQLADAERLLRNSKIYLDRDTNVALLGEVWQGGAVGLKHVVMLTLGSGVGGAVMVNGEIDRGENGQAGELGHMIIQLPINNYQLPICGLGHEGCLEAWINSAKNIEELGTYLGYGLANIVDIFNPQKILIGGGKIHGGDFLPLAVAVMKEKGMKPAVDEVEVEYAKLKDDSGIYGAARLAM